jgi:hypothetical protein
MLTRITSSIPLVCSFGGIVTNFGLKMQPFGTQPPYNVHSLLAVWIFALCLTGPLSGDRFVDSDLWAVLLFKVLNLVLSDYNIPS